MQLVPPFLCASSQGAHLVFRPLWVVVCLQGPERKGVLSDKFMSMLIQSSLNEDAS